MANIRWENPPAPRRVQTDWREVARLLRSRPGEWAVVYEGATDARARGHMSNLRRGQYLPMLPAGDFEYQCFDGLLYARYVGAEGCQPVSVLSDAAAYKAATERQVSILTRQGLSASQIAVQLGVADRTVVRIRSTIGEAI